MISMSKTAIAPAVPRVTPPEDLEEIVRLLNIVHNQIESVSTGLYAILAPVEQRVRFTGEEAWALTHFATGVRIVCGLMTRLASEIEDHVEDVWNDYRIEGDDA
jgi:hypothetical protein